MSPSVAGHPRHCVGRKGLQGRPHPARTVKAAFVTGLSPGARSHGLWFPGRREEEEDGEEGGRWQEGKNIFLAQYLRFVPFWLSSSVRFSGSSKVLSCFLQAQGYFDGCVRQPGCHGQLHDVRVEMASLLGSNFRAAEVMRCYL